MTPFKCLRLCGTTVSAAMVFLLSLLCLGSAGAWAANCTVSLNTDTLPNGVSGELRFCLNNLASGLPASTNAITFSVSLPATITLAGTLPDIENGVTITGPVAANQLVISGAGLHQAMTIGKTASPAVVLSGITVANAANAAGNGGGISIGTGSLTVSNSVFSNNSAANGAAIYNGAGTVTISGSTFLGNSASADGGALDNNTGATLTVTNSTFSKNSAPGGGAIYNAGTTATVVNNTFSGNSAGNDGAGILNAAGTLTASNNLFVGNTATTAGAGIDNNGGGTANANFTVYYNNLAAGIEDDCNSCTSNTNSTSAVSNPLALPLGNNGGPTQTFLPQPGSAAICAASAVLASGAGLTSDQRGFAMDPSYTLCAAGSVDAGAVQTNYIQVQASTDTGAGASDCNPQSVNCTLRDAIALATSNGYGDIDFASQLSGNTVDVSAGPLTIPSNTVIQGPIDSVTYVNAFFSSQVFLVNAGTTGASIANLGIQQGSSSGNGGGIENSGSLTITACTIQYGTAAHFGAGIYNAGTLVVTRSLINNNTSLGPGAGIYNALGATLTVTDSTFTGNAAAADGAGGGISNASTGTLTAVNNTISGNSAGGGGGIFSAGTATYANNIVSGNTALSGLDDCDGAVGECPVNGTNGNLVGGTVNLSPLSNNGVAIESMIPEPGSPAICGGSLAAASSAGLTTDQRGLPITGGGYCPSGSIDSGAVQTNYSLGFTTDPPANVTIDQGFGAAVTLNESGNPFSGSSVNIPLTISSGTLSGTTTEATSAGVATYSGLSATLGSNLTLSATIPLNLALTTPLSLSVPSSDFSVAAASTAVALTPASQSSSVNLPLTFTATVSPNVVSEVVPANVIPISGAVAFSVAGQQISNCGAQPVTYNPSTGTATATCTTSTLLTGNLQPITAVFTPGGSTGSDYEISPVSPQVTATVTAANTSVVLTSSATTSVVNQPVTFTAAISPNSGPTVPQGTVAFTDSVSGNLCTTTLTSGGTVPACTFAFPGPPAAHTITATFTSTSPNFNNSSNSSPTNVANLTVNQATTSTSLTSTPNPSAVNQQVAFAATVTPQYPGTTKPTGTVSFVATGPAPTVTQTTICPPQTLSNGAVPVCNYAFPASGSYTVVATYNADSSFASSSSPSSGASADVQTVNAGSNSVVLTSSLNPSVVNQPVVLSATISVSNSGSAQPTGSVVYADSGVALPGCTFGSAGTPMTFTGGNVPSCTVAFSSATSTSAPVVSHSIVATFTSANSNFTSGPSNTVVQTVNKGTPVTAVTSLPNPAAVNAAVTATATVTPTFAGAAIPSGNVIFTTNPVTTTCTETIVAGVVPTCTFTFTAKNTYDIVATYQGDQNFNGSPSGAVADAEAVGVEATTVALTSSLPSPPGSTVNQSVTFNATINVTSGSPTGVVTFKDGATVLCTFGSTGSPATFANGVVPPCAAVLFTAATHAITATYSGDSNFGPSTGNLNQTVSQATTATTIVSTVASVVSNSAPLNTPVTYTATVTPTPAPSTGSLSPTGTVTFQYIGTNGTLPSTQTTLCAAVGVSAASGTATAACVGLLPTAGTYAISAIYNGDSNFSASNRTTPPNAQTVTKGATTTSVTPSSTTSSVNQSVAFTATVVPSLSGGTAVPTGSVGFVAIGPAPALTQTTMCQPPETISNGIVPVCNYTFTASGTYTVVATYNADSNFTASSSPSSGTGADVQTVTAGSNSVALSSSLNPSMVNQPVVFSATISVPNSGMAQPTGSVVYADSGTALPGCSFGSAGTPMTFTGGLVPSCPVAFSSASSAVVTHSIVATFTSANSNFNSGPSNTVVETVNKATPVTAVTSLPNPSAVNTPVTATATVTPPIAGGAVPSGNVVFTTIPATTTCTETIVGGVVPTCTFTFTSKNTYVIVAAYQGDSNFIGSSSPTSSSSAGADVQSVSVQATSVILTSSLPSPPTGPGSTVNQAVTFTAAIKLTTGTTTTPTGTVTYYDGATPLNGGACTFSNSSFPITTLAGGTVVGTVPSCTATLLTATTHAITAVYSGDTNFGPSTGNLPQTVNQETTSTTVVATVAPSPAPVKVASLNTPVTFTATVAPNEGFIVSSNSPTGTVNFTYGGTPLCTSVGVSPGTGMLAGSATAACTVNLPLAGTYPVIATYSADSNFSTSASVADSFTINATSTTVSLSSSLATLGGAVVSQLVTFTARVVSGNPGPVAPNGVVVFQSTDGTTNTAGNCGQQTVTAVASLTVANGFDGIAHCSVQFPITEQFTAPISIIATYMPTTSPVQDFDGSSAKISQTVQNYSVAFTSPAVSSAPPALTPVFVTQGFTNTSDPFNPKTSIAVAVTTSGGFPGGFSDSLNVTCSVTAVSAIPSAGIISGQAVSDPSCAPASNTLATSSGTSSYALAYTVSASATAPIGAYYVTITVNDSGPQMNGTNGNGGAKYSLTESTVVNPVVYVVGETTSLTLAQGALGVENAVFNTEAAVPGSSLVSYACGKVFTAAGAAVPNPSSAPVVTCTGPTETIGNGSNPASNALTAVPIQVSLASSASAQLHRSNPVSLATLLGVPLLALMGWIGSRKSPRRNFFRFIGMFLLMVAASYAFTGCGGSFTQTGTQPNSGGLGQGSYLVQVIAYDGPNQTGNQYFAVVPLTVNANSAN